MIKYFKFLNDNTYFRYAHCTPLIFVKFGIWNMINYRLYSILELVSLLTNWFILKLYFIKYSSMSYGFTVYTSIFRLLKQFYYVKKKNKKKINNNL